MTPALGVSGVGGAMALYGAADAIVCFFLGLSEHLFKEYSDSLTKFCCLVSFILYVFLCWYGLREEILSSSTIALIF